MNALPENRQKTGKGGRRSTSFRPGQSGNPGGRPKKDERLRKIEDMARDHSEEAIAALLDVAKNGSTETARVAAAQAILDRGWGTPVKRTEAGEPGAFADVEELSEEELQAEKLETLELAVKSGDLKVLPIRKK